MAVLCLTITSNTFSESLPRVNEFPGNKPLGLYTDLKTGSIQAKLNLKKISFKERILWKWFEKKLTQKGNSKNSVNRSGFASLVFSIIAALAIAILLITDKEALLGLFLVAIIAGLLALIFATISLIKRSKLKDRTGAKTWPAFTGIIFSILTAILLAVFFGRNS